MDHYAGFDAHFQRKIKGCQAVIFAQWRKTLQTIGFAQNLAFITVLLVDGVQLFDQLQFIGIGGNVIRAIVANAQVKFSLDALEYLEAIQAILLPFSSGQSRRNGLSKVSYGCFLWCIVLLS